MVRSQHCLWVQLYRTLVDAVFFRSDSQSVPILPNIQSDGTFLFNNAPSGGWFDPNTAYGFSYIGLSSTLFSSDLIANRCPFCRIFSPMEHFCSTTRPVEDGSIPTLPMGSAISDSRRRCSLPSLFPRVSTVSSRCWTQTVTCCRWFQAAAPTPFRR